MATIVNFTRPNNLGYYCNKPDDQSGFYVPLAEYQDLLALIRRVIELGPSLHADSIADVIRGKTEGTEKLIQLLEDCEAAAGVLAYSTEMK